MALKEEFVSNGNWLFRWRSYVPLVMVGLTLLAIPESHAAGARGALGVYWELFCLTVSFLGLGIRILTIGHTPFGTSGRNTDEQQAEALNTTGIYSVVRHPLYLGNFFIWIGLSLYVQLWWLTLLCVLGFWVFYERIMFAEEEFLRGKFGERYTKWAAHTPAFIPAIKQWRKANLPFSTRNVLKREYSGFYAIIVTFVILELATNLILDRKLELSIMWIVFLAVGTIIYLTLRTLKKKTKVLAVEGR